MIDFAHIENYRENNRIEAKKALGGLPNSIWESYSAFANTLGGVILLGVEEYRDKSLHTIDLPDPEGMIEKFWTLVNDPKKASLNILSEKDVTIETVNGNRIIAIHIPRAQRTDKPIYIDGNPMNGSYRRGGEGDYRCRKEEVEAMLRDASVKTQDMKLLEDLNADILDFESIHRYRAKMQSCRPRHAWEALDDRAFLYNLGAVGRGVTGKMHPTAAGLLMFGRTDEIVAEYPCYSIVYQDEQEIISSESGNWSGNLYDFYALVEEKLLTEDEQRYGTQVQGALCETLANCIINADYHGTEGIRILKTKQKISFSNPGGFRVDPEAAKSGGISDPRNSALVKMFRLVDLCNGRGGGIPSIFRTWKKQGWAAPTITEHFDPDSITFTLPFAKFPKKSYKKGTVKAEKTALQKQAIVEYLTENITAQSNELAELIGVKKTRITAILKEMCTEGIVIPCQDINRYKLSE